MKLVIDIPEEDYIRLRDEGMFGNVTTFKRAVKEGIPLEQEPCADAVSCNYTTEEIAKSFIKDVESVKDQLDGQPCTDAISRQAVLNLAKFDGRDGLGSIIHAFDVEQLPPVKPAEKVGHWQEVYAETDYHNGWIEFSCENCKYQHGLESGEYGWYYGDPIPWKYCPICGKRMM